MGESVTAYLAVGSNMGDKAANCLKGIQLLDTYPTVSVESVSPLYRTAPMDYLDQDWFINGALSVKTVLDASQLLTVLKTVEEEMGQFEKAIRFGPRIVDLDILFYGDRRLETDSLVIPHPRMHQRCFVLKPLCDIAGQFVHPVFKRTIADLLADIENDPDQKVVKYTPGR